MEHMHDILLAPIVTERATMMTEKDGRVAFEVPIAVNKYQVREAVETVYGVKVENVRTMIVPGKLRRRAGGQVGKTSKWKKAVVKLAEGDNIDFFASAES